MKYTYCSLHNHTEYSNLRLIDSINRTPYLLNRAIELNMVGLAITDHECLSSHVKAIQLREKLIKDGKMDKNFKLILGDEIYLIDNVEEYRENYTPTTHKFYHFIILSKNKNGYEGLKLISSTAWSNIMEKSRMERVPIAKSELKEIMKNYKGDLIASTACLGGELPTLILKLTAAEMNKDEKEIYNYKLQIHNFISMCIDIFGQDDFYLELQPSTNKEQIIVNKRLQIIAKAYNIKCIFTTDSHYLNKEDRYVHKDYLNSKNGEREIDSFYQFTYLMPLEDVKEYLSYLDKDFIEEMRINTIEIADKCENYDLYQPQIVPTINVNNKINKNFKPDNIVKKYLYLMNMIYSKYNQDNYWVQYCINSMKEKGLYNEVYLKRLDIEAKELWLVSDKLNERMTSYYNTMQKIIEIVWSGGDSLVGPARGSATGFLSCYLLGITQIDPIIWNLPHWRHLSETRPELPDVDFDTQASRRVKILEAVREFFNPKVLNDNFNKFADCWNVLNIATFGTEGPKSACLTACRGYRSEDYPKGIDPEVAQFLTSMIPQERGKVWSINDCINGNEEKGRKPIKPFINELNKYPRLIDIIIAIEGLVNKRSNHASGVYIYNDGFISHNALMKSPSWLPTTQFDMTDSDYMGSLKYDFLTVEAMDKIRTCLDLLVDNGEVEWEGNLKKTYDKYLYPNKLEYNSQEIWDLAGNGEVINLFQFDTDVGSRCIKKLRPRGLSEAASANSLMRLMAEKGEEQPMDRFLRMRNNIDLWYNEMKTIGLTEEEEKILEPHYLPVFGTPNTQEDLMETLMDAKITNFDLTLANKARKIVAKKKDKEVGHFKEIFYEKGKEAGSREIFLNYVWKTCIKPQLGYSFSRNHVTPYTFLALQELTLYNKFPSIYWNTACLTVNSGSAEVDENEKQKNTDYTKIAVAIGDMQNRNIEISLVDINKSSYGFFPDIENNKILFGIKGINSINKDELIKEIINNRPYISIEDLNEKVKLNKTMNINLIKSGAFDKLYPDLTREQIMKNYIHTISGEKTRLTLQNFNGLIDADLVPEDLYLVARVYKYTKVLKKFFKEDEYFNLSNEEVFNFYEENFDSNLLENYNGHYVINQKIFDKKIYQPIMDRAREWIKENKEEILSQYNKLLFDTEWNKSCGGGISKWEMDSLSFYYHEHELSKVNLELYGISKFSELPKNPIVDYTFKKNGNDIPIYKLTRIIGTVIGKNKSKGTINLLTTDGVVPIRFRKEMFAIYDKQISQKQEDGKKKVMEKSWFNKGSKIMLTGFRRDDEFIPKKYANTSGHTLYKILEVNNDGTIELTSERYKDGIEEDSEE